MTTELNTHVTLLPIVKGQVNPFELFPKLQTIWSPELYAEAYAATEDWLSTDDSGEIYLIFFHEEVVGITGWWPLDATRAGLRWHGVADVLRGKGISTRALAILTDWLKSRFKHLVEITMTDAPVSYFCKVGFIESTDPEYNKEIFDLAGYKGHRVLVVSTPTSELISEVAKNTKIQYIPVNKDWWMNELRSLAFGSGVTTGAQRRAVMIALHVLEGKTYNEETGEWKN